MANVLPMRMGPERARRPVDPSNLPDPGPFVAADIRQLIDVIGRGFEAISVDVNTICRTTWVDPHVVEGWYNGAEILCSQARALVWLAGIDIPSLVPMLLT